LDGTPKEPVKSCPMGFDLYGSHGLLASSVDLGWSGLAAELRTHPRGVIEWKSTTRETELCVAIDPVNAPVTRLGGGVVDRTIAQRGTVWLCPAEEHLVDISTSMPQILHIYLAPGHFSGDRFGVDLGHAARASLHFERGFQDPLVAEIAFAIVAEMQAQTAGGRLLAETLAVSLVARLMQRHSGLPMRSEFAPFPHAGLDRRRLTRVKEYIETHLEGNLGIAELARIASLSQFHFARAFKIAVGQSPHQYVSTRRLEHAKEQLVLGDRPLLDIAIGLSFSSQANFTRAFRTSTGMTPGQYRRGFTHAQRLSAKAARRRSCGVIDASAKKHSHE
jgi:AraC family transcriptional regulator